MQKRFIVFVDFSEHSANLLEYALDWSKQANAQLLLVHQTKVLVPGLADTETKGSILQISNSESLAQLKKFGSSILPSGTAVSYLATNDHFGVILRDLLAERYKNLIFVGLKEASLLKKIFIGSTAFQVIENTNNIVVAIPMGFSKFRFKKIFVAVSDQHPLNIMELNKLLDFGGASIKSIVFFHLAKPFEHIPNMEKQLMELTDFFSKTHKTSFAIYEGSNSFDDIKKIINNDEEEMLVVQKGSRFLADQLFRKFLITELVHQGHMPLVVLP